MVELSSYLKIRCFPFVLMPGSRGGGGCRSTGGPKMDSLSVVFRYSLSSSTKKKGRKNFRV